MAERLGRYTVLRHLASGGMADVLLASTDGDGAGVAGFTRHVLLKRIRPEYARDQRFISMFLDEARLAATLHHGNVVQVFDIGEANGEYFFAMEYVHGEDLRALLSKVSSQRTHVPLQHAVAIAAAAAAGLHYAHERRGPDGKPLGLVHRDVSPSNLLLGFDGTPKLVDFGIAKATTSRQTETRSGGRKGKLAYMSPEQARGEPVDRRSDVYSLGVVLYELATTTRLFKGESEYAVMDAIVHGRVPLPRVRRPDLPNELSIVIMKALAPDRERRFQTADELRLALDQVSAKSVSSTNALADYMRKTFGEKPEPWLVAEPRAAGVLQPVRGSWTELSRRSITGSTGDWGHMPSTSGLGRDSIGELSGRTGATMSRRTAAPTNPPVLQGAQVAPPPTSGGHGWTLYAVAGLAVIAIGALGAWKLAGSDPSPASEHRGTATSSASGDSGGATAAASAAGAANANDPAAGAAPLASGVALTTGGGVDAGVAQKPTASTVKHTPPQQTPQRSHVSTGGGGGAISVVAPVVAPEAPVVPSVPAPSVPEPVVTQPPTPAPTPTPVPPIAPVITHLSDATVQAVAADHRAEISDCVSRSLDGAHGQLTIHVQLDANGHITQKQMSSTLGKPKFAGCVLGAVGRWQFPKPPTGAADATYTLTFQ